MCGRYVIAGTEAGIIERFRVGVIADHIQLGYNLAPSQQLPVIAENKDGQRELRLMEWGLKKPWWKPGGKYKAPINARAETVTETNTWKDSIRKRRCIVPASGYYEWQGDKGKKQPYYIHLKDEDVFAFAGLWEEFRNEADQWVITYAIITTTPAEAIAGIHDRMPVILHPEDEEVWLDRELTEPEAVLPLLKPFDSDALEAYPVSPRVGNAGNDDPGLIEPIARQGSF